MEARRIRRYEQRLRKLNITIPVPFDAREFCTQIAERRGRPITIVMVDAKDAFAPCGLWVSTEIADYVAIDRNAPPVLRDHILMHELSHMLCDHRGLLQLNDGQLDDLDQLDPAVVERVLGRASGQNGRYGTAEENEAEGLASVIADFAAHRSPVPRPRTAQDGAASVLDRFSSALAGDRHWL